LKRARLSGKTATIITSYSVGNTTKYSVGNTTKEILWGDLCTYTIGQNEPGTPGNCNKILESQVLLEILRCSSELSGL
jgi:hypothetical protein